MFIIPGLKLTFDGKAVVKWSEVTPQVVGPSPLCSVHKLEPITRTDSRTYFNLSKQLFGDGENPCVFPPGENSYNFSFQIPPIDLPSTYASRFCKVEYLLEVKLTTSERVFDQFIAQKGIRVCPVVDLNKSPALMTPGGWQVTKNFSVFCYSHGDISIQVTAPRNGYHPGEVIDLTVDIDNSSSRTVMAVVARLVQEDTYLANGKIQVLNHQVFNSSCQQRVPPFKSETFCLPVNVPRSAPPTNLGNCEIIKVYYKLQVFASIINYCPY